MKKIAPTTFSQLVLLLFLVVPRATTQVSCDVDQGLRDMVDETFSRWSQTKSDHGKVYVSNLSFMDGVTKTLLISNEVSLIDEAIKDGIYKAAETNPNIVVNEVGHTIPNTNASVVRLAKISFNPNLTPEEKYREAVKTLLDPHGVDVLVSGVVVDTGTVIQVKPIGVSRPDEVIKTKDRSFTGREELFQEVNGTLALTDEGREEITKAVKDLIDNL